MYSYCSCFYKPGKSSFKGEEIEMIVRVLSKGGFKTSPLTFFREDSINPMSQIAQLFFPPKVSSHDLRIEKSGGILDLHLHPAQEKSHGLIGEISIPEEQFEQNPEDSTANLFHTTFVVFEALRPLFAWTDHELELSKLEPALRFDRVGALAAWDFFSKELTEKLGGRKKLLIPEEEKFLREEGLLLSGPEFSEFTPFFTTSQFNEPLRGEWAIHLANRFPEAILRSFEIVSKTVEREK